MRRSASRPLRTVSAIEKPPPPHPGALDVVHLNGIAGDIASQVTFSTMQYAARLARRDHAYERLADDASSSSAATATGPTSGRTRSS